MQLDNIETKKGSSKQLYTGLLNAQIIAVNPSRKQIAEIFGKNEEDVKEPNYVTEKNTRIDFWFENHPSVEHKVMGKFAIWVSKAKVESKEGNAQYIDSFTRNSYAKSIDALIELNAKKQYDFQKLDISTVRHAKEGEVSLYSLLVAYANADTRKPFQLDSFDKVADGNIAELRDFFSHFNNQGRGVKLMLGVKDGKYQDVFTKIFLPIETRKFDYLEKNLRGDFGFKSDWQSSLSLKEYNDPAPAEYESSESTDNSDLPPFMTESKPLF